MSSWWKRTSGSKGKIRSDFLNSVISILEIEFKKHGVVNVFDIRKFSESDLISWFGGAIGPRLYNFAFGVDERVIESNREKKQLSRVMTIKEDSKDFEVVVGNVDFLVDLLYKKILSFKVHTFFNEKQCINSLNIMFFKYMKLAILMHKT